MGKSWFPLARKWVSTGQNEGFVSKTTFPLDERKAITGRNV